MMKNHLFTKLAIILTLALCSPHVWGDDIQHYVGCAINPNPSYYDNVKLNVNRGTWGYHQYDMSKAGLTYEGKNVYIANYQTNSDNNKIYNFQFQLYDGSTQKWSRDLLNGSEATNYYDYYIYDYDQDSWYTKQVMNDSRTYFDATGWSGTDIRLVITHTQLQKYHTMYPVTGTKLYYTNDLSYWDNAMGVGVVSGGSDKRTGNQHEYWEWLTDISSQATEYTGLKHYSMNNNDADKCYLIVNNGKTGEQPTITYEGTNYLTLLNNTQTLNTVLKAFGADEYTTANSKAEISISSYELTGQGATTNRTSSLSTSENTETVTACRTATTVYTVGEVAAGYQFDGFYDSADGEGSRLDAVIPGTYTFYPTSATTVYARFSEKTYDVSVGVAPIDGDIIGGTATPSTLTPFGQVTGGTITATSYVGYYFTGWEGEGGTYGNQKVSPTTFIPDNNTTVTATFDYRWSIAGGTDEYSPDEMGDWDIKTNLIAHIGRNASSKDTGYVNIDLPANTDFQFLIKDRETDEWYKNGNQDSDPIYYMTYTNHTNWDFGTGKKHNCGITTAGAGTYKFAWNITDKLLTVYFPASYKVTYNDNGSTSGSVPTDNDYYANGATVTVKSNSGSLSKSGGYVFGGWNTKSDGTGTTYAAGSGTFTISQDTTLYAQWDPEDAVFTKEGTWSDASNWTPAIVPTLLSNVVIKKPVTVDVKTAKAKSVVLDQQTGNTGKLIINAGKELVIAGTLRKTTDGSSYGATAAEDVVINSDASNGLGALVMRTHDGTNQATVNFYTLSHGTSGSSASVAQYVGVPFTDATVLSAFYNSWVYRINHEMTNIFWERMSGSESLRAFKGYSVFSADGAGHTYEMQGTLVSAENKDLNLYYNGGIGTENPNDETLLANSWMAPIKIAAFTEDDFTSAHALATIYIFNAGSLDNYKDAGGDPADNTFVKGDGPGQYSTYPIAAEKEKPVSAVIPAMQSFSVFTNKGKGASTGDDNHLILDYNRLVYDPAVAGTTPVPNRSPRRAKAETSEREEMLLCVRGANGPADRVRILAHEDFDEGFENGWDGHKIFGESFTPQLYAMTTDGNMAVNCIPEYEGTVLGFKPSDVDNSYTFYFRYDGDETLYLNDLKTEQSSLIQDENTYPFTSSVEDAEARFVISATPIPHTPTGIQSVQSDGEQGAKARKLFINGAIYIIRSGRMYDVLGKTMRNEK